MLHCYHIFVSFFFCYHCYDLYHIAGALLSHCERILLSSTYITFWYRGIVVLWQYYCRARLLPSISHCWSTYSNCRSNLPSSSTLWISKQKQNWIFWSVHNFDPNCTHSKLEFSTKIWFQQYIMYHYVALSLSNIKQMTKNLEIIILKWKKTWAINTLYIALLSATWQTQIWMNIKKISSKYQ